MVPIAHLIGYNLGGNPDERGLRPARGGARKAETFEGSISSVKRVAATGNRVCGVGVRTRIRRHLSQIEDRLEVQKYADSKRP
jgi:hypothetical protein